jgi:protein-tyrosine-phosphatase/tRNA A37 threonylcarbamoyladenosine synthetase subunit TsaC/SUA5/YrdC
VFLMPTPLVIEFHNLDDKRDAIHRAVQAITEGKTVVLPSDSCYFLATSGLHETACQRVHELRQGATVPLVALKSRGSAFDFAPQFPPLADRLTRRCWPGPLHIQVSHISRESVIERLPANARLHAFPEKKVQFTVALNGVVTAVLRLLPGPLLLWPAMPIHEIEPVTVNDVLQYFPSEIDLVISTGRSQFSQPATIAEIKNNSIHILRPGIITEQALKTFSGYMLAIVCTGNTCRSPMAEMVFKKLLAERLQCKIEELEQNGVTVISAGTAASLGCPAAENAVEIMQQQQLDLSQHESQPLNEQIVKRADLIITMTRSHREAILQEWPEARDRTYTLSNNRADVSDPIGGPLEQYRRCAEQIENYAREWVKQIDLPPPATFTHVEP